MSKRVYLLLGGIELNTGSDGWVTSAGMRVLETMLAPIPVHTDIWGNWQHIMPLHNPQPGDKTIIVGYSGGGSRATWLANERVYPPLIIDLMVLYDPSPRWQMEPVGPNVLRAITYQNSMPMGTLGCGVLVAPHTKLEVVPINEWHLDVQNNQDLHKRTVEAIQAL